MNGLSYLGILLGLATVLVYLGCAAHKKRKAELSTAISIFVAAASLIGAVRLMGFVLFDDLTRVIKAAGESNSLWSISSEDAIFLVIGGLALGWVSIQTVWEGFAKLR